MARCTPKRVCRNVAIVVLIVIVYFLFNNGEPQIEYSEDMKAKTSLISDFWVPEKSLVKVIGQGDGGSPVYTNAGEEEQKQMSYSEYGFNQFISDKISLNRTVPDTRPNQ